MTEPFYAHLQLKTSIIFILIPLNITSTLSTIMTDVEAHLHSLLYVLATRVNSTFDSMTRLAAQNL